MFLRQVDWGRQFKGLSHVSNQAASGLLFNTGVPREAISAAVWVYMTSQLSSQSISKSSFPLRYFKQIWMGHK